MKYQRVKKANYRKTMTERQDCTVIALAILCRIGYKEAHDKMAEKGRAKSRGTTSDHIISCAEDLGFTVTEVTGKYGYSNSSIASICQPNGCKYTPKTIGSRLKKGYYLCLVRGHVFSVVNGIVEDWTNGRKHQVFKAYKFTRSRG